MAEPVTESLVIDADPSVIYDLVADVTRMGEWSPEATGALRAGAELQVGDTFVGLNKRGLVRWFTICRVTAAQPGERFEFDVDFGPFPVSRWTYELTDEDGGTRVTETWLDRRDGARGAAMKAVGQLLIPGNRTDHNRANMVETLRRLKAAAETAVARS